MVFDQLLQFLIIVIISNIHNIKTRIIIFIVKTVFVLKKNMIDVFHFQIAIIFKKNYLEKSFKNKQK